MSCLLSAAEELMVAAAAAGAASGLLLLAVASLRAAARSLRRLRAAAARLGAEVSPAPDWVLRAVEEARRSGSALRLEPGVVVEVSSGVYLVKGRDGRAHLVVLDD